jgi:putative peptidoglycan lipid II flippase
VEQASAPQAGHRESATRTGRSAAFVAFGILCSRLTGLVRQRVFAHYFGLQSDAADAFSAAFRIPNFLQNLFGEGALSASFIPVYASAIARGDHEEASHVAGAVAAILSLATSILVLLGVVATPLLIDLIAPGFDGDKRDLTITLVRVLFPGAGLLVLSAWCLGILNSHRRFLLSYMAPVVWNAAMIATLVAFGGSMGQARLAVYLAWASVVGSALQFLVQLPVVLRLLPRLRFVLDTASSSVRIVLRNFGPVFLSRGVVQISAYVDGMLASLLPTGAVAGLANAQLIYTLPVSLFGMSVSAAELPAMAGAIGSSGAAGDGAGGAVLRDRLEAGLRRIAFFVVPSSMAFVALGDVIAAALLQTGNFSRDDAVYVWGILAGSAVGLLASTLGRLYSSSYYALRDTRTPLRFAVIRVALTIVLGYFAAIVLPPLLQIETRWGTAGLTASAGVAGWIEFVLLRHTLAQRIGKTGIPPSVLARLWFAAALAGAIAYRLKTKLPTHQPLAVAAVVLTLYGVTYLLFVSALGVPDVRTLLGRALRRR